MNHNLANSVKVFPKFRGVPYRKIATMVPQNGRSYEHKKMCENDATTRQRIAAISTILAKVGLIFYGFSQQKPHLAQSSC